MIYPALKYIANELNADIYGKWGATINGTSEIVQLDNIANIGDDASNLSNKIIFTLIKVEEESSLKNGSTYAKSATQEITRNQPAIYLNLYLLVSITKKDYGEALQLLSDTIIFFQAHRVFSEQMTGDEPDSKDSAKLAVDLYNISFQESFDLWSTLGSKQFPSVIYRLRLLKFKDTKDIKRADVVKVVQVVGSVHNE